MEGIQYSGDLLQEACMFVEGDIVGSFNEIHRPHYRPHPLSLG